MIETEEIVVEEPSVACDGGGGALGHPRVWLAIPSSRRADCPYCGRIFIWREGAPSGGEIAATAPEGVTAGDRSATVDAEPQA